MCEMCDEAIEALQEDDALGKTEFEQLSAWMENGDLTAIDQRISAFQDSKLMIVLRARFMLAEFPLFKFLGDIPLKLREEIVDGLPDKVIMMVGLRNWIIEHLQAQACRVRGIHNPADEYNPW